MQNWQLQPARDFGVPLNERIRSVERESGIVGCCAHVLWWSLVRAYLRFRHRLEIEGLEHVPPEPPMVLVANHASHLDALVLASALTWRWRDRIFPVAAGDTFFVTPVKAVFASFLLNALPMWRHNTGAHGLQQLRRRIAEDRSVFILFPEGTRSRDGTMGTFKSGIGMLLAETNVPVVPCYLEGTFAAFPTGQRWPSRSVIRLRIGPPLVLKSPNNRSGWDEIAAAAEAAVRGLMR